MSRTSVVLAVLAFAVVAAWQTYVTAQNALPPDQQAYQDAWALQEPEQQIAALNKVASDYPKSRQAMRARMGALRLFVKLFPSRRTVILRHIDLMLKAEKPSDPGPYDDVATVLADAGVLLDKAQTLSEKTVKAFTERRYIADLTRDYAEAKMPLPDPARLTQTYNTTKAALLGTLGRIYLKQGKFENAQRIFTEAERSAPTSTAAAGLGAVAYKDGKKDAAYDYFLRARLTGVLEPDDERAFEALFAARHGAGDSLPAVLDQTYRKLYPSPIHVTRAPAARDATGRAALLEVFTGAGCPPCAGADLAVDAVRERYDPAQLVVLMHHVHIPRPDPMTNADTAARASFYGVQGAPTYVVDGTAKRTGGGSREDATRPYETLTGMIDAALETRPEATITARASLDGRTVRVQVEVAGVEEPVDGVKVRVALVERELRYGGENGIRFHPMVVRALAEFPLGRPPATIAAEFDVDRVQSGLKQYLDVYEVRNDRFGPIAFVEKMFAVDESNLGVAVVVQRDGDRRVLQSAHTPVTAGGAR